MLLPITILQESVELLPSMIADDEELPRPMASTSLVWQLCNFNREDVLQDVCRHRDEFLSSKNCNVDPDRIFSLKNEQNF